MGVLRSLTVLACAGVLCTGAVAEPRKAPAAAESTEPAHLRIWKDALPTDRPLRVVVRPAVKRAEPLEVSLPEGRSFFQYLEFPPGTTTVELGDPADPKKKLLASAVHLAPGRFYTVLFQEIAGKPSLELIDDTVAGEGRAQLTVRNLIPGTRTLSLKIGEETSLVLEGGRAMAHLRGLPRSLTRVDTSTVDQAGKRAHWVSQIDFATAERATLLIVPDTFGRLRPRVIRDGFSESSPERPVDQ